MLFIFLQREIQETHLSNDTPYRIKHQIINSQLCVQFWKYSNTKRNFTSDKQIVKKKTWNLYFILLSDSEVMFHQRIFTSWIYRLHAVNDLDRCTAPSLRHGSVEGAAECCRWSGDTTPPPGTTTPPPGTIIPSPGITLPWWQWTS